MQGSLRAALVAGGAFGLVALASVQGWLLPLDEALLGLVVPLRTCPALGMSNLASLPIAIESVLLLTGLLVVGSGLAGGGWRAAWLGAWALSLPLELILKVRVVHPLPANALGITPPVCDPAPAWLPPALAALASPTGSSLLNVEGDVVQPVLGVALGHTFPSGSVLRLTFFTVLAALWLWSRLPPARRTWALGAITLGAAGLAGSRLVLMWHWPSDVLGGVALGTALACVARWGWQHTPPRVGREAGQPHLHRSWRT